MSTNESKHTALPWQVFTTKTGVYIGVGDKEGVGILDAGFGLWSDGAERDANAAFIVRAVNSYDDLLAVAEMALRVFERDFPNGQGVIDIRAAIAKAEGSSHA